MVFSDLLFGRILNYLQGENVLLGGLIRLNSSYRSRKSKIERKVILSNQRCLELYQETPRALSNYESINLSNLADKSNLSKIDYQFVNELIIYDVKQYIDLSDIAKKVKKIKMDHGQIQYQIMMTDIGKYPPEILGTYRGLEYRMRRPHNTYWCGYIINYDQAISDEQRDILDQLSHWGLTAELGFDCCHAMDFYLFSLDEETYFLNPISMLPKTSIYRTHDYVLSKLKAMIDYLVDGSH